MSCNNGLWAKRITHSPFTNYLQNYNDKLQDKHIFLNILYSKKQYSAQNLNT